MPSIDILKIYPAKSFDIWMSDKEGAISQTIAYYLYVRVEMLILHHTQYQTKL